MEVELKNLTEEALPFAEVMKHVIAERARAKEMQDAAKEIIENANAMFTELVSSAGIDKAESNVGTVYMQQTGGKSMFNKDKAKDNLLKAGVDSDVVAEAFKKATSVSKKSYTVGFRLTSDKE